MFGVGYYIIQAPRTLGLSLNLFLNFHVKKNLYKLKEYQKMKENTVFQILNICISKIRCLWDVTKIIL